MIDIGRHIEYWRQSAQEDWEVALQLVESNRMRHGLFFAHLAIEKLLKCLICSRTQDLAPRIHNLVRLAEAAGINPSPERLDVLAEMNAFNIEGRYPDALAPPPTPDETRNYMARAEEVLLWLTNQL